MDRSLRDVNTRVTAIGHAIQLVKWPALITGAGYAAEGLGEVGAAAIGLTSALAPLSGLLVAYPGYLGAFAQALGVGKLAIFGVSDAVKEMSSVQETAGTTAKESGKAQESAAEGVRSAQETLNSSVRSAKDARVSLTAAEKEAVTNLVTLKDAAVDASLAEKRSALDLHDAKAALRKAENEPGKHSRSELNDLELSVAEARQGVKEAEEEKRNTERERDKGQRQGVQGNPKVLEAKRALNEANHQITVSARALKTAQKAETESFESTSSAATGLQQKLATMPIAGQKFAKFIFGLQPKVRQLQATAANGLLPGAEKGISKALSIFPRLNTAVSGTSKVMGEAVTRAGEFVGSKGFGRDFSTIAKGNETLIARMGSSGIKWADALRQVLVAGQPLLDWISRSGLEFSTWVDNATKAGRQSGSLSDFFEKTRTVTEKLTMIVGNLGGAFLNIGKAAAPLGEEILSSFARSSESFQKWTDSMRGQNELKKYFEDAKPGIFEMGRLVRDASKDLLDLSKGPGFLTMTRAVRTELLPVLTEMVSRTTEAFGPALVRALVQVGKLLGNLAGTSGPLTLFVNQVTSMLEVINWGFKNVPGLKTFVVTLGGIATVAKALKFTGMVTGLSSSLDLAKKLLVKVGLIDAASTGGGVVGGAPIVSGGVGRTAATTVEQGAGEFGEKQALRDAGLLSGGAAVPKAAGIAGRLGLLGADGLATTAGLATAGVGTVVITAANALIKPDKLGESPSHEKELHLKGLEFNVGTGHSEAQFLSLERSFGRTMGKLRSDAAVGMTAIDGALSTGLNQANETWAHGTPKWRQHTAEAMRAAVKEIEQGIASGTIKAKEGEAQINRILSQLHLKEGRDPFGLAQATTKQFKEANDITAAGVSSWTKKLERMPAAAREQTRNATLGMLAAWAQGHPKLEAQVDNLTNYEVRQFGSARRAMEASTSGAMLGITESVREGATNVGGALENIFANLAGALTAMGEKKHPHFTISILSAASAAHHAREATETGLGKGSAPKKAGGGITRVAGSGLQDTVPLATNGVLSAIVAPGEDLMVVNRHQRPALDYAVANTFGVGGMEGFFAANRKPHFMAGGGEVKVRGSGLMAGLAGDAASKVQTTANSYLNAHMGRATPAGGSAAISLRDLGGTRFNIAAEEVKRAHASRLATLALYEALIDEAGPFSNVLEGEGAGVGAPIMSAAREIAGFLTGTPRWTGNGSAISLAKSHPRMPAYEIAQIIQASGAGAASMGRDNYGSHQSEAEAMMRSYGFAGGGIVGSAGRAVAWARNNIGTQQGSKKEIKWADETGGVIDPWCAEFVSADMAAMGLPLPGNPAYSGSFVTEWNGGEVVGHSLASARVGDLLNFENEHIGIYVGGGRMISGNWSDEVAEALVSEDSHGLSAVIRPHYAGVAGAKGGKGRRGGTGTTGARVKPAKPGIGPATSTGAKTTIGPAAVAAVGPLAPGVVSGAASWLPPQFRKELTQPGLNFAQKLNVANEALAYSEETGTSATGAANYGIELEEANKKRLEEKLKTLNKELKGSNSPKKQASLLKQREGVLSSLSTVKSELRNFSSAKKAGEEGEAPRVFTASDWANAELAEAELTPGKADDRAVQEKMLGIAEQELATAKANNDPEAIAAAAQAIKQLDETLKQSNALAEETLTTSAELALAELTPESADDEAAKKKLLQIAEAQLANAEAEGNREAIIQYAGEVKGLREAIEASNQIAAEREGFEKEQLEVNKRLAKIAEEQGPAFMGAFVAYLDGAIGGPLQTNSRLATAGVAANYQ